MLCSLTERAETILAKAHTTPDGCMLYRWALSLGTKRERAYLKVDGKPELVYRIVYRFVYGEVPAGKYVLHKCGNGDCVNPKHLYLGTQVENAKDSQRHGVMPKNAVGLVGVTYQKSRKRYIVMDSTANKCLYQGRDLFEACCRRLSWENARKETSS